MRCFNRKKELIMYKVVCLNVNGKQSVKLRNGSIKFNKHSKKLTPPLKIYTDFESITRGVQGVGKDGDASYTEKYQEHIPCSFAYSVHT